MRNRISLIAITAGMAAVMPAPLAAQSISGQNVGFGDEEGADEGGSAQGGDRRQRTSISPYIEASQILSHELSPDDDTVTFTQLAVGVDTAIAGRRNAASVSLRYERNIAYGDDTNNFGGDVLTGVARGSTTIVPNAVTFEAGGLASRSQIDADGSNVINPLTGSDSTSETYSAFAGPSVRTRAGDVDVTGSYRLGYTRVETPNFSATTGAPVNVFDSSVSHSAQVRAGTRPGEPLPVGVGVGAGFLQEDINALDQRVRDAHIRGDVTVPVTPTVALVGGLGYEDVEVSSRDALLDANGVPVLGDDGRLVTDDASPRSIAFDATGLIWDVGVVWRPSRRTQLQAGFGRRYDSETYYGNFSWQPSRDTNLGISLYDGISGLGGQLSNSLAALPVNFDVIRDPISGDIVGCVNGVSGGNCLSGLLGSVRSSVFRSRGVAANFSRQIGRMTAGLSAGYDRRSFIGAENTILAGANGVVDESYFVAASLSGAVGTNGNFTVATYGNYFDSGFAGSGNTTALGSSVSYNHRILSGLSARSAVALNYLENDLTDADLTVASALVGLRYDF
jgi:hypothetical protein